MELEAATVSLAFFIKSLDRPSNLLQKYITKNKKENKNMFLFSSETAKMVKHTSPRGEHNIDLSPAMGEVCCYA